EGSRRRPGSKGMMCGSAMHPRSKVGRSHKLMPKSDPKALCPPAKYKPRRGARALSAAEIKAAADRAEARSKLTAQYSATTLSRTAAASEGALARPKRCPPEGS